MFGLESLLLGRTIADRYRIDEVVGRGRTGPVCRAVDVRLGFDVAVKAITAGAQTQSSIEGFRARLRRAAQAAAAVQHPNVAAVYDSGTDPAINLDYVVMELLRGEDLGSRLAQRGRPPVALGLRMLLEAVHGLAAVHAAGLAHGDLRPENLFLTRSEDGKQVRVRLLAFGVAPLAAAAGGAVPPLQATGAASYAAPEHVRAGGEPTQAGDVFSLGAVGFLLLAGAAPFSDGAILAMAGGQRVAIRSPRELNPDIPPELAAVILRAVSADPAARFANASQLLAALEPLVAGLPMGGTRPAAAAVATAPAAPAVPAAPVMPAVAAVADAVAPPAATPAPPQVAAEPPAAAPERIEVPTFGGFAAAAPLAAAPVGSAADASPAAEPIAAASTVDAPAVRDEIAAAPQVVAVPEPVAAPAVEPVAAPAVQPDVADEPRIAIESSAVPGADAVEEPAATPSITLPMSVGDFAREPEAPAATVAPPAPPARPETTRQAFAVGRAIKPPTATDLPLLSLEVTPRIPLADRAPAEPPKPTPAPAPVREPVREAAPALAAAAAVAAVAAAAPEVAAAKPAAAPAPAPAPSPVAQAASTPPAAPAPSIFTPPAAPAAVEKAPEVAPAATVDLPPAPVVTPPSMAAASAPGRRMRLGAEQKSGRGRTLAGAAVIVLAAVGGIGWMVARAPAAELVRGTTGKQATAAAALTGAAPTTPGTTPAQQPGTAPATTTAPIVTETAPTGPAVKPGMTPQEKAQARRDSVARATRLLQQQQQLAAQQAEQARLLAQRQQVAAAPTVQAPPPQPAAPAPQPVVQTPAPAPAPAASTDETVTEEPPALLNSSEVQRAVARNYPPLQRDNGIGGRARARFAVREDGTVDPTSITILDATNGAFGDATKRVLRGARYRPARVNGHPVRVMVTTAFQWGAPQ